jgi:hypothetical protein
VDDTAPPGAVPAFLPPFTTRLVNILDGDRILYDPPTKHDKMEQAIERIRSRENWKEGMEGGIYVMPELQAQVLDATGTIAARLACLECHYHETATLFGQPIYKPALIDRRLKWVPITEQAGAELARRAFAGRTVAAAHRAAQGE